jgi:heat shock protein HtpX
VVSPRMGSLVQHMLLISESEDAVADWLDSHPTLEQRIKRIYGRRMGPMPLEKAEAPVADPGPLLQPDPDGPGWTLS